MKRRGREKPSAPLDMTNLAQARELFWQNIMREMLTALAMQRARQMVRVEAARRELAAKGQDQAEPLVPEGFDGRMAVVTAQGERIPIADVTPLFACSIGGTQRERALSEDVQCTIFQIRTPSGEVYTLPVGEIRGFHALTQQAMQSLQQDAARAGDEAAGGVPFGFAAFTSLARELAASGDDEDRASKPDEPPGHRAD